jgi:predicted RNase H-like HicB family nuclease/predicted transcriptional regulator
MSTVIFVALVTGDQQTGYRATFPDVSACSAEGRDLSELLMNARQALMSRLDALANAGEEWPPATPIEQLGVEAGVIPVPIDVAVDDPPIRVNVSLGERLVQRLDAAAEARGMTRSGFIAQAVRASLGETARGRADFDAVSRRLQDELGALGQRINDSIGPESPFTRRMIELDDRLYDGVRKAADSVSAAMARRREAAKPSEAADRDESAPRP